LLFVPLRERPRTTHVQMMLQSSTLRCRTMRLQTLTPQAISSEAVCFSWGARRLATRLCSSLVRAAPSWLGTARAARTWWMTPQSRTKWLIARRC
jgi:hypothetical protein